MAQTAGAVDAVICGPLSISSLDFLVRRCGLTHQEAPEGFLRCRTHTLAGSSWIDGQTIVCRLNHP